MRGYITICLYTDNISTYLYIDMFAFILEVSSCSATKLCLILRDPMDCSTPGSPSLTISQSLPKFTPIESVCNLFISSSDPLFSFCLQMMLIFSSIRIFSNESAIPIRWPKFPVLQIQILSLKMQFHVHSSIKLSTRIQFSSF